MLLIIDNYDSFTYNLVQYFRELGCDVLIARNDALSVDDVFASQPEHIVISPGPGTPDDAGIALNLINENLRRGHDAVPLLGICLGHQAIVQACGGKVIRAPQVMHGKTSEIVHLDVGVFKNLPSPLTVTRYHSLIADSASLPEVLMNTAWTRNDAIVMGVQHQNLPIFGVQFHPESILTQDGRALLNNFVKVR